jgi:hypothetical protein
MKPSTEQWFFYQQIGKVFYSIAAVDKTVRPEEIKRIKENNSKEWLPLENTLTHLDLILHTK